jgi:hypothetical protein
MKKIIAILAMAVVTTAFADSVTVERQAVNNIGSADQITAALTVKHDFNSMLSADIGMSNTQTTGTKALSTRLEVGMTTTAPVAGTVTGYVRGAVGEKYANTTSFAYYSIEPGIFMPVGPVVVKAGYRYRSATDSSLNGDQTHTARLSVSYALTQNDTIGIGYDRVRGDNTQNITKVNYTRGF